MVLHLGTLATVPVISVQRVIAEGGRQEETSDGSSELHPAFPRVSTREYTIRKEIVLRNRLTYFEDGATDLPEI